MPPQERSPILSAEALALEKRKQEETIANAKAKQEEEKRKPPVKKERDELITPQRYAEIDAVVSSRPETVSIGEHAINMSKLFGDELHQYGIEWEARNLGISKPNDFDLELPERIIQEQEEMKRKSISKPEQLPLI